MPATPSLPELLASHLHPFSDDYTLRLKPIWAAISERVGEQSFAWPEPYLALIVSAFTRSAFVAESCSRFPDWLQECSADDSSL